jgi:adenosylcobyric acid synthase
MLGRTITDPEGIEGTPETIQGLGLLDVETRLAASKSLERVSGRAVEQSFSGYEMHVGITTGPDCARPFAELDSGRSDGAISADGRISGTYVHGLFASTDLRRAMMATIGGQSARENYDSSVNQALDEIAAQLEEHTDIGAMIAIATGQ